MKAMHDLKKMLCKELDKIADQGELTAGSLETAHKLTDTIKNIDKIMRLEDVGDDGEYSMLGMDHSRNRGGDWEARGNFGRHIYDGGNSYANRGQHYVRGHYSRDDGKEHMMRTFGELMESADPEQRRIIQRAIDELKNA